MKIQYGSDLHLELPDQKVYWRQHPIEPIAPILVLAGDVMSFSGMEKNRDVLDFFADHFEQVYWVPGNHEYYRGDISIRSGSFEEKIRSNVHLLNNRTKMIGDTCFIFSTLWAQIRESDFGYMQEAFPDFKWIKKGETRFSPEDFNALYQQNLAFIQAEIESRSHSNYVVVTHHVPTLRSYPPKFLGNRFTQAFATDLDELMEGHSIDFWVFGHHHAHVPPFKIGNTTLLTNQLGYVRFGEHHDFKRSAYFECV